MQPLQQIQKAENRDKTTIHQLSEIWEASVRATHTFLSEEDIAALRLDVALALAGVAALYRFADEDGQVQGFLGVEEDRVEMLFLHPRARGCGIGSRLLSFAVEQLGTRFVDVNEQNTQGVGFYQHMGFRIIGRSELDGQGRPFPILHMETPYSDKII